MGNARTVLLVEQDAAERKQLEQVLAEKGYTVTTVSTAEEAIWKLDNEPCDALFTSVSLRGMSGLELTAEARARRPGLPIVVMAGEISAAVKSLATTAGATDFLRKPLSSGSIADVIARVLPPTAAATPTPPTAAADARPEPTISEPIRRLKNIILFLLAPFVGLVYLLSFPIVGMGMLIWTALAWKKRKSEESGHLPETAATRSLFKSVAMVPGALLLGVTFAIVGPLLGIGVLLWFSFQAWGRIGAKALAT